jgi:predicted anti-sigma-YlaC factor YlaD
MTTKPNCRDVEGLVLEDEDHELAAGLRRLVEDHLRGCEGCRAFAADRNAMRRTFSLVRWPAPPEALVRRTRRKLLEARTEDRPAGLPSWVLIAMAFMTVATSLWLAISLADVTPGMTLADWPIAALAAALVIVQNAVALVLAPILLRTARARRTAFESAR